ncbi:MAG: Mut7-C RNAse domain-containing protein [Thermodesulfovibrionales bacterium]|nr:Mut7-C RNAse domain-containing protein [Thermodesulfovibrionales bacterium]
MVETKEDRGLPALIADAMLGRLARWLRILGYDTLYSRDIQDRELIRKARQEQRIILTRDRGFAKKAVLEFTILISSQDLKEQIKEAIEKLTEKGFSRPEPFRRCPACNALLEEIAKEGVSGYVPDHIYLRNSEFLSCPICNRIYWRGSHEVGIRKVLGDIL